MDKTTTLMTCTNSLEANIIKGRLANEGIQSFTANDNFSSLMPHFNKILGGGVQVVVYKTDYKKALQILGENNKKATDTVCPNCGSKNISFGLGRQKLRKIAAIILSLLLWIPFNNINNIYYCTNCKTEF